MRTSKRKLTGAIFVVVVMIILSVGLGIGLTLHQENEQENITMSIENAKKNFPVYVRNLQKQLEPYGVILVRNVDEPVSEGKTDYTENYRTEGNVKYDIELSLTFSKGIEFFNLSYYQYDNELSKLKQNFDYDFFCKIVNTISNTNIEENEIQDFLCEDEYIEENDIYSAVLEYRRKSLDKYGACIMTYFLSESSKDNYDEALNFTADLKGMKKIH